MAKFKQIQQNFLFRKLVTYWGSMIRNYNDACRDDDFFEVVRNNFEHDKAVELIEAAYAESELEEMRNSRSRGTRIDLEDSLEEVFNAIWNHEKMRGKCKSVLESIREYMLATSRARGTEPLERRFADLKRALKLDGRGLRPIGFAA